MERTALDAERLDVEEFIRSQYGDDDLRILRERTGCDFIITRILGPFETPPVWQGQVWSIYAVPK